MKEITIKLTDKEDLIEFDTEAWRGEAIEHYGERVDWIEKDFAFKALENNQIIGSAKGKFEAGVIYLQTIIVSKKYRGKGVGKKLLHKIFEWTKPLDAHKIVLFTMPDWDSCRFYKSLGFELTGKLPKHYLKRDFVIYSKDLD